MTVNPKELRELAEIIHMDGAWSIHSDASVIRALRDCADLIDRSPVVTDEVIIEALQAYDYASDLGYDARMCIRKAIESVWPVVQPIATKSLRGRTRSNPGRQMT